MTLHIQPRVRDLVRLFVLSCTFATLLGNGSVLAGQAGGIRSMFQDATGNAAPPAGATQRSMPQVAATGAGDGWVAVQSNGDVRLAQPGGGALEVVPGTQIPLNATLTTGTAGRAVLARGNDRVTVAQNSELQFADSDAGGLFTRVVQKLGTLLFRVERSDGRRFEVQTPYLTAIVKGTTFSVSVRTEGATVHVTEGAVQVAALGVSRPALIRPGQTATVSSEPGADVQVIDQQGRVQPGGNGGDGGSSQRSEQGDASSAKPGSPDSEGKVSVVVNRGKPAAAANGAVANGSSKSKGKALRIDRTLGAADLDFHKLTRGLVGNARGAPRVTNGNGKGQVQPKYVGDRIASKRNGRGLGRATVAGRSGVRAALAHVSTARGATAGISNGRGDGQAVLPGGILGNSANAGQVKGKGQGKGKGLNR